MTSDIQQFKKGTGVERALIVHSPAANDPYLGHSFLIFINNENQGLLYSFEYNIKSVFAYTLYKKFPRFYRIFEKPIDILEQLRVILPTQPKTRTFSLSSKQLHQLLYRQPITPSNLTPPSNGLHHKQLAWLNKQIAKNPYSPSVIYFSKEQGEKMLKKAVSLQISDTPYQALSNNCIQNIIQIFQAGGITLPSTYLPSKSNQMERSISSYQEKHPDHRVEANWVHHQLRRSIQRIFYTKIPEDLQSAAFVIVPLDRMEIPTKKSKTVSNQETMETSQIKAIQDNDLSSPKKLPIMEV